MWCNPASDQWWHAKENSGSDADEAKNDAEDG